MSRLTFWKKRDLYRYDSVPVGRNKAVEEGMAETLDCRSGACKPGSGDTKKLTITTLTWRSWRKCEMIEAWEL